MRVSLVISWILKLLPTGVEPTHEEKGKKRIAKRQVLCMKETRIQQTRRKRRGWREDGLGYGWDLKSGKEEKRQWDKKEKRKKILWAEPVKTTNGVKTTLRKNIRRCSCFVDIHEYISIRLYEVLVTSNNDQGTLTTYGWRVGSPSCSTSNKRPEEGPLLYKHLANA